MTNPTHRASRASSSSRRPRGSSAESSSFRRNLGERLTEAVQKEIELKTPYKVTGDPSADSELRGRIVGEGKRVVIESRTGEPREF